MYYYSSYNGFFVFQYIYLDLALNGKQSSKRPWVSILSAHENHVRMRTIFVLFLLEKKDFSICAVAHFQMEKKNLCSNMLMAHTSNYLHWFGKWVCHGTDCAHLVQVCRPPISSSTLFASQSLCFPKQRFLTHLCISRTMKTISLYVHKLKDATEACPRSSCQ